jgi:gamma-glutamylputrescine oxidase
MVRCEKLFVCTNAYLHQIAPRLAPPMAGHTLPVASAMLATEPLPKERMPLPDGWAGHDTNWVVDYFRPTGDGRLLFGGRAWYGGAVPQDVRGMVRARLLHAFPQLHDVAIHSAWGGLIAITTTRMPHVGSLGKHSWFAHGYSGHGMALSVLLGQAMAQAALGDASAFAAFAQVPQRRFPGGRLLAKPLVQLAMAAARLRDSL